MNLHRAPRPPGARYALQPAKVFSRGRSNRTSIERKTIYRSAAQGMRMAACQATRIIAGQSLGFVRFLPFQASPGRSNSTTIYTHYLPNHTRWNCIGQASNDGNQDRSALNRPMDLLQNQFYSGGRVRDKTREDWTRRAGKVPHIASGTHFMREKKGFRSVPILSGVT